MNKNQKVGLTLLFHPDGSENTAHVRWKYRLEIVTEPKDSFSGKVKAKIEVHLKTKGAITIANYAKPIGAQALGCSVTVGILSFSVPPFGGAGDPDYGTSVAGADTSIKIASLEETEGGDVSHDYSEVGFPIFARIKRKEFVSGRQQKKTDEERVYTVGTPKPTVLNFWCKWACGSNASKTPVFGDLVTSWVPTNDQAKESIQVKETDGAFEIQ